MTTTRYIVRLERVGTHREEAARFTTRTGAIADLNLVFESEAVSVATTDADPTRLGGHGVILGALFGRVAMHRVNVLESDESDRIVASRERLIDEYWGPYVAIIADPVTHCVDIIRAPLGELPCYIVHRADATIVASDIDLLIRFGYLEPSVSWGEVRHHLTIRDLRTSRTCLQDLAELPGGQRLTVAAGRVSSGALWSPWAFKHRDKQLTRIDDAAEAVESITNSAIAARAASFDNVVLMLSGGLDSSIVAAGLARAGSNAAALTLVTRDAIGDERHHARRVSDRLALPLIEGWRDVSRIDIARSGALNLPRPTVRLFLQESTRLAGELADQTDAQALFNGGGGDSVFCSLQSASPAVDRLRNSGVGPAFWRTANDIAEIAQASVPVVIADVIRRAWLGKPVFAPFCDTSLLSQDAVPPNVCPEEHPWLTAPKGALPGGAAHVRLIAFAQSYVEGFDPQATLPTIAPLLAQPLVETCLRIPSWLWCDGGRNRAVARRAFAPHLPRETTDRRSKGTPDSFVAEIFETHRASIREMLADGLLVQHRLVDRDAILRTLAHPGCTRGDSFRRILQFVDVEAWAQSMVRKRAAAG